MPGWKWSESVGPLVGVERCSAEHVGLVVFGVATAAFADGRVVKLRAGDLFYIPPEPHDSWGGGKRALCLSALLWRGSVRQVVAQQSANLSVVAASYMLTIIRV